MYLAMHIYIEDMRTRRRSLNEAFLVKIANIQYSGTPLQWPPIRINPLAFIGGWPHLRGYFI